MIRFRVPPLTRPRVLDVALTIACIAAMYLEMLLRELTPDALDHVSIVLTALPVLIWRQYPGTSLVLAVVVLTGMASIDSGFYSTIPGPAVLCAYAVADHYGRRAALTSGFCLLPATLLILHAYSPHALLSWGTAQNLALVVLPLSLGVAAHDRRAWSAALIERARAAEHNQEETARRRVSEERLRIARDVHDVVAHAMVTINVQAGVGAYLVRTDPDEAHAALRTIKQVSGSALADLRSMLGILREVSSDAPDAPVQGIAGLDELAENLRTAGVDLTVDVDAAAQGLPTSVDTTAYRIVQESLTNTLRHAGPTRARITVTRLPTRLLIEVSDEGGTPAEPHLSDSGSGNGLRGMRERAIALGGSLEAGPRPGGGWQVTAALPLSHAMETS